MASSTYSGARSGASHDSVTTTEYGEGVLEGIEADIRDIDKSDAGHWTGLFGRIAKLRKHHNGGSIAWDDAEAMLYAVNEELGLRTRLELHNDIRGAVRKVGNEALHAPGESRSVDRAPLLVLEPPPREYASPVAVDAIWENTVPCVLDDDAYQWLTLRGISAREVEFQRLARFMMRDAAHKMTTEAVEAVKAVLPRTKLRGEFGVATQLGFRIVVPMYDADGVMRSLRLRRTNLKRNSRGDARLDKREKPDDRKNKELGIKGAVSGLVLANGPALHLLRDRGRRLPEWGDRELAVVIAEGVPDFLVASCEPDEAVRAVFGICGPSCWSLDIASRIPFDARVEIATDSDGPGNSYAKQVAGTLPQRRLVSRWRPHSASRRGITKYDVSDVFGLRGGASHVSS